MSWQAGYIPVGERCVKEKLKVAFPEAERRVLVRAAILVVVLILFHLSWPIISSTASYLSSLINV